MQRRVGLVLDTDVACVYIDLIFDGQAVQYYECLNKDFASCSSITEHDMQMTVLTNDRQRHFFCVLRSARVASESCSKGTRYRRQQTATANKTALLTRWVATVCSG